MTSRRTAFALGLALALTSPPPGVAQRDAGPDGDTPEGVVCALFGHLEAGRWEAAARLFDERMLDEWHRAAIRRWAPWAAFRIPPVEEYLESNPGMPREVAEYELERARKELDQGGAVRHWIAVESIEELRDLSPREAVARALQAHDPHYQRDVTLSDPTRPASMKRDPPGGRIIEKRRRIVGTVALGDRAFVAYRVDGGPWSVDPAQPPPVLPLVRTPEGWRALPDGEEGVLAEGHGHATTILPDPHAAETPSTTCGAPSRSEPAPGAERAARRFLERVDREAWGEAAELFAEDDLKEWFDMELQAMTRDPGDPPTVEQILASDPDMPRAVAEWQAERRGEQMMSPEDMIRFMFGGVESLESLRALSPQEAAARSMEAWARRGRRSLGGRSPANSRIERESEVLGAISEGEYTHVLYRVRRTLTEGGADARRIEVVAVHPRVLTLRPTGSGWAIVPRLGPGMET